jgi:hypothetical protein
MNPKTEYEIEPCNIIAYLAHYGGFLNGITAFVYLYRNPQCCRYTGNSNFTRIESRCEIAADMVLFLLTGKFNEFRLIDFHELSLKTVIKELYRWNLICLDIPCRGNFAGHVLTIIRDNDVFYIIQSYIFNYNLKVYIANETQIVAYIGHYLDIFWYSGLEWSKSDIAL